MRMVSRELYRKWGFICSWSMVNLDFSISSSCSLMDVLSWVFFLNRLLKVTMMASISSPVVSSLTRVSRMASAALADVRSLSEILLMVFEKYFMRLDRVMGKMMTAMMHKSTVSENTSRYPVSKAWFTILELPFKDSNR